MCGVAGFFVHGGADGPADPAESLGSALDRLAHRGPDGRDVWIAADRSAGLAHARLAVIDLAGGRQPMENEDGTVRLVFNGEIYDFEALRDELEARGHRFRSRCDAEVVLHLWEEMGPECVTRLEGMFAFAIHDARSGRLFLARDRLGKKPLAFARRGAALYFASELDALRVLAGSDGALDETALGHYLAFGYIPPPLTIDASLERLRPGERMTIEADGRERRDLYWTLPDARDVAVEDGDENAHADRVEALLSDAVRRRLVADVPLGAFLSGGLDSLAVVAFMAEAGGEVRTLTVRSPIAEHDESAAARAVAEHFGTEHHEIEAGEIRPEEALRVLRSFGEPFGDSSAVASWALARAAREHVTVVLTGDGGDELFAGYVRHRYALTLERLARMPFKGLAGALPGRTGRAARLAAEPAWRRYFELYDVLNQGWRERILEPEFASRARDGAQGFLRETYEGAAASDSLDRMLRTDLATWLPDDLCAKVDITSMAHGLECRCPFLDHRLVEASLGIPSRFKLRGRVHKRVLRTVLRRRVPERLLAQRKRGFAAPVETWMREGLKDVMRERLLDGPLVADGRFRRDGLERLIDEHLAGHRGHRIRLWVLFALAEWMDSRR